MLNCTPWWGFGCAYPTLGWVLKCGGPLIDVHLGVTSQFRVGIGMCLSHSVVGIRCLLIPFQGGC